MDTSEAPGSIAVAPKRRVVTGVVSISLIGWLMGAVFLARAIVDQISGKDPRRALVFAGLSLIATCPGVALMLLVRRHQGIDLDDSCLEIRLGPLATQRVPSQDIGSVELHEGLGRRLAFDGLPLVIRDRSGKVRAFFDPSFWDSTDLERIWARLGVTVERRNGRIRSHELSEQMRWATWSWAGRGAITGLLLGLFAALPLLAFALVAQRP